MLLRISIKDWIEAFEKQEFSKPDRTTQIKAGWYDWFCKDEALRNKTYKMGNIISRISGMGKISIEKNYLFFKNNCPLKGKLYDDFRFCSLENGSVQFTVQLESPFNEFRYVVYGRTPDDVFHSDEPLIETNSIRELVNWFNTHWDI